MPVLRRLRTLDISRNPAGEITVWLQKTERAPGVDEQVQLDQRTGTYLVTAVEAHHFGPFVIRLSPIGEEQVL